MALPVQYTPVNAAALFGLFPASSRRRIKPEEALDLVPTRAPHVEWTETGEDIVLSVRRRDGRAVRALSWFFTLPDRKTFQLDRIGAAAWRLCDGATPVREIARHLAADFGWPEEQARASVLQFLSYLSERRLIGFPATDPGSGRR